MATIHLRFRSSTVPGKEGTVEFQVTHLRTTRLIKTGCRLFEEEWDAGKIRVVFPERASYIQELKSGLAETEKRLRFVIDTLTRTVRNYTAADVVKAYQSPDGLQVSCFTFAQGVIDSLRAAGKIRTAETYTHTLRSFARFRKDNDLLMGNLTADVVEAYETYLKALGLTRNTSSFYLGIFRAIYRRAVAKNLVVDTHPFRNVFTGMEKTRKRAVDARTIHRLLVMDLRQIPRHDFARDMFMFSFYTRGMSFVDMAFLQKKDLEAGILTYCRQKSGQWLTIRWEDCMQRIVDKYATAGSPYLLPIITRPGTDERQQYLSKIHNVNRNLREIGEELRLELPLTLYVARHSWANIAYNNQIPVSVISEGLGHDSEKTTRIYLSSLDTGIINSANRMILDVVQRGEE